LLNCDYITSLYNIAIPQFQFITRQEEQLLIASKLKEAIQAQADQNERFSNDFQTVKKRLLRLVFKLMLSLRLVDIFEPLIG